MVKKKQIEEISKSKPFLIIVMSGLDTSRLSQDALKAMMIASHDCNINKIKEIIADSEK